ncbi:uncharacterized protein VTP21DRAFT_4387 [Calcarisporiella thermophila]|uniref:uncharacterized protein n=1 Tax=Calcarisporiella thermophila TaxID=911321 RepID=UPI0037443B04
MPPTHPSLHQKISRVCDACKMKKRHCNGQLPCSHCSPKECSYAAAPPGNFLAAEATRGERRRLYSGSACETCRRRKTKCDGNQPCGFCAMNDYECINNSTRRGRRGANPPSVPATSTAMSSSPIPKMSPLSQHPSKAASFSSMSQPPQPSSLPSPAVPSPLQPQSHPIASPPSSQTSQAPLPMASPHPAPPHAPMQQQQQQQPSQQLSQPQPPMQPAAGDARSNSLEALDVRLKRIEYLIGQFLQPMLTRVMESSSVNGHQQDLALALDVMRNISADAKAPPSTAMPSSSTFYAAPSPAVAAPRPPFPVASPNPAIPINTTASSSPYYSPAVPPSSAPSGPSPLFTASSGLEERKLFAAKPKELGSIVEKHLHPVPRPPAPAPAVQRDAESSPRPPPPRCWDGSART